MRIGVPKEIKVREYRVGLTPNSVTEFVRHGHEVFVQSTAGDGIGFSDEMYEAAGATILPDAAAVFETGELIVKVKEPQPSETPMLKPHHTLYTYLHLAADAVQAEGLRKAGSAANLLEDMERKATVATTVGSDNPGEVAVHSTCVSSNAPTHSYPSYLWVGCM